MDTSKGKAAVWSKVGGLALGCVLTLHAASAEAAPIGADETPPADAQPVLTGELAVGVHAGRQDATETAAIAPRTRLGMRVRPEAELNFDVGVATLHQRRDGQVSRVAEPSNLGLGFRFVREQRTDRFRHGFVGFEFALPTATALEDRTPSEYAIATGGGWSPWRWSPATLALIVPGGIRGEVLPRFELGVEGAVAGLFPAGYSEAKTAIAGQAAGHARYVLPWLGLGVRGQAVYNGGHETDRGQLSVAPTLDTTLCRKSAGRRIQGVVAGQTAQCPVSLMAAVHVNIDRPYGFLPDGGLKVWAVQVGMAWAVF